MPTGETTTAPWAVDDMDKRHFEILCQQAYLDRLGDPALSGIGTLREKTLHNLLKRFLCADTDRHEVRLLTLPGVAETPDPAARKAGSRYIADVLTQDGRLYEVQTGSLSPLSQKIGWCLQHTPYPLTLLCPLSFVKWLRLLDPRSGQIGPRRRSPVRQTLFTFAEQLYFVRDYIGHPRFAIEVWLLENEEYRQKNTSGRGYLRHETIPRSLLGRVRLQETADYRVFLPPTLPAAFTASQYGKAVGISGKPLYSLLKTLEGLGLLAPTGERDGRSRLYRLYDPPPADAPPPPAPEPLKAPAPEYTAVNPALPGRYR